MGILASGHSRRESFMIIDHVKVYIYYLIIFREFRGQTVVYIIYNILHTTYNMHISFLSTLFNLMYFINHQQVCNMNEVIITYSILIYASRLKVNLRFQAVTISTNSRVSNSNSCIILRCLKVCFLIKGLYPLLQLLNLQ